MAKKTKDQKRRIKWAKEGYTSDPPCYLCGTAPATTDDHVPPAGLFATTKGSDAYWLPACGPCNNSPSSEENYFRNVLAASGRNNEAAKAIDAALSGLQRGNPLYPREPLWEFLKDFGPRDVVSEHGVILGRADAFRANELRLVPVATKIVRGLHYHDTKKPIAPDATFDTRISFPDDQRGRSALRAAWDMLAPHTPMTHGHFRDVLRYVAWQTASDRESSIWFLTFYESILFVVRVNSSKFRAATNERLTGLGLEPSDSSS